MKMWNASHSLVIHGATDYKHENSGGGIAEDLREESMKLLPGGAE